jgi:hypothetical protein
MRKTIWAMLLVSAVFFGEGVNSWSQSSGADHSPEKRAATCHLEFSLNELEDGKKLNVRHYSMDMTGGNFKELKIGTRVPIEAEQGKFQYLDVGSSVRAKIYGTEDAPILDVTVEVSSFANPDQSSRIGGQPLLRQIFISGSPLLLFDKSMIIGAVDDPNSKRQYQLELVATKIK